MLILNSIVPKLIPSHHGIRDEHDGASECTFPVCYYTDSATMAIENSRNTCAEPDTKSNPNPNPNPNSTTKQHPTVNIQQNIVTCPTYPQKFIQNNVVARFEYL